MADRYGRAERAPHQPNARPVNQLKQRSMQGMVSPGNGQVVDPAAPTRCIHKRPGSQGTTKTLG